MAPVKTMRNILMELRKVCQHPYLSAPELENEELPDDEQHKRLINGSGKLSFLRILLPKLKERGHRVLLFSQFKIALDRIQDFLYGEGYKFLRLDGDVQQAQRQKSMDAFNAPDSEFFIFLLTTRAGGVGINLATADTVIMFDPDFNPHMDLQAIARSHRYGQKKPTLVFKLMAKDSVEEQIIWKGKKKMVLDHLVVQQMGKETEEGDIDSILLHGAKALYNTDANGVAPSDIQYNSKNVDELIDKLETEAATEAKAMEEREAAVARGEVEDKEKAKESMAFGFAKIWEADKDQVAEVPDDEEEPLEEMEDAWRLVMDGAQREKERQEAIEAEGRARRRKAAAPQYKVDPQFSDDSPQTKKKKDKGKKAKGKAVPSSDDAEFVTPADAESESDDETVASFNERIADLLGEDGDKKSKRGPHDPVKAAEAAARLQAAAAVLASRGVNIAAPAGEPARKRKRDETPEQRAARKKVQKLRQLQKYAELKEQFDQEKALNAERAKGTQSDPNGAPFSSGALPGVTAATSRSMPTTSKAPVRYDPQKVELAQQVLQWLYHVLRELRMKEALGTWAMMGVPELPTQERRGMFLELARQADEGLEASGQPKYFSTSKTSALALYIFDINAPVVPDKPLEDLPRLPPMMTFHRREDNPHHYQRLPRQEEENRQGHTQAENGMPNGVNRANGYTPSPLRQHSQVTSAQNAGSGSPAGSNHASPQVPALPPPHQPPQPPQTYNADCGYCKGPHKLEACSKFLATPDLPKLLRARQEIQNGQGKHPMTHSLTEINRLIHLRESLLSDSTRQIPPSPSAISAPTVQPIPSSSSVPTAPAPGQLTNGGPVKHGTRDSAIVIDDDEPVSKSPNSKRTLGCTICHSDVTHIAVKCPVVLAGPESMKASLARMDTSDPMHSVLQDLLSRPAPLGPSWVHPGQSITSPGAVCPFCETLCGRTVRHCAEAHGGRKKLKNRIKQLQSIETTEAQPRVRPMLDALFLCYQGWPNPLKAA
ncbi:hypothetical protein TREMEDRAFT_64279 [Tremella mesenterica DSM 1558]|uniref:uncharacterized protein n=1 Tax=Tremella mesenterica (strain ATCC 24925 / CBS 8224 / DSM 1558 / NBRC 9311 / NRRL Y-6157 / RJB 2259-6 / UBC 559-6) TaxID=578456 RepID=UPI0003F490CD|nr:uncharacterized protein TREMEDRAFT_64279 [Tremella mesenterica DSM 1558]EIW67685.1 hypothetical protein TREMEDRAFT_64279 [Tremella mesenterica DSM 1558]